MLEPRDIRHLKLDTARLLACQKMVPPSYVKTTRIGQYSALNDAIISEILGISTEDFLAQLKNARRLGTSYVHMNGNNKQIGISGATSLIKGPVISKNLIVPMNNVMHSPELSEAVFISAFIRNPLQDGLISSLDDVEVAGWATASEMLRWADSNPIPASFKSTLQVCAIPCSALNPIDTLRMAISR